MAVQKVLTVPNPILRQKSKPVVKVDKETLEIIKDLRETLISLENPRGAGLSAPQIGKQVRICLVYSKETKESLVFINPEITWKSKKSNLRDKHLYYEGCLSVPGYWGLVKRAKVIKVRYLTLNSRRASRRFSGLIGAVVQHEIDHLDGILFIDRILAKGGKLYKMVGKDKQEKDIFKEVEIV